MEIALVLVLVIAAFVAHFARKRESKEAKALIETDLPTGCRLWFDKRVSGRSRKGVITYYSHFVRAVCESNPGSRVERVFDFDHHDKDSRSRASYEARNWVTSEYSKQVRAANAINTDMAVSTNHPVDGSLVDPHVNEKPKLDRYGRPIHRN